MVFKERVEKLNSFLKIQSLISLQKVELPFLMRTYLSNFVFVPKHIIDTIDMTLYNFVWRKKHSVKRTNLIASH